jgi:large subunit ribosomal protein L25
MRVAHTLNVESRSRTGSRYAKRERAAGKMPAVVYGHGKTPVHITVDSKETLRYLFNGEKVFSMTLAGEREAQTVIVKDVQFDYLGNNPVHLDFSRVSLDEKIEAHVHVKLIGEAVGLKKAGAILTTPRVSITVKCTVLALPDHIDVDISGLDMDQEIHMRDVKLPAGVELADDPDSIVAAISEAKAEEVVAEGAAVEGAPAGPEVITAKKEEGKEGEAAKGAAPAKGGDKGGEKKKG